MSKRLKFWSFERTSQNQTQKNSNQNKEILKIKNGGVVKNGPHSRSKRKFYK